MTYEEAKYLAKKVQLDRLHQTSIAGDKASTYLWGLIISGIGGVWYVMTEIINNHPTILTASDLPHLYWIMFLLGLTIVFSLLHILLSICIFLIKSNRNKIIKKVGEPDQWTVVPITLRTLLSAWVLFYLKFATALFAFSWLAVLIILHINNPFYEALKIIFKQIPLPNLLCS